jgi:hypothetical protein
MLFTSSEIFDVLLMTYGLGFIFKDVFQRQFRQEEYDPLKHFKSKKFLSFNKNIFISIFIIVYALMYFDSYLLAFSFSNLNTLLILILLGAISYFVYNSPEYRFAIIVTAPAIILHELGHKFIALSVGATANFHAAYTFLALAVILKLASSGIIFFVPAYVSWVGSVSFFGSSAIAFAGPAVNLALWLGSWAILEYLPKHHMTKRYTQLLILTKQINMFLFGFNMIPLRLGPFSFDGYQVFHGLLKGFGFF